MAHKHTAAWLRNGLGLAVCVLMTLWGLTAPAAAPLSITAYRDAYVAAVMKAHPDDTVAVKADNVVDVTNAKGDTTTSYLDHGYSLYQHDPDHLADILTGEVATLDAAGDQTYTADQLIVVVRPAGFLPSGMKGKAPLHRDLADGLIVLVAADQPQSWAYPSGAKLRHALKLKNDEIWARALANTAKQLPGLPPPDKSHAIAALSTGHGISSSLLAEPDIWDTPAMQVGGAPVVAPVDKDVVLFVHAGDAAGIAQVRAMVAKAAADDPDALTQQLYLRKDGDWQVLTP